MEGLRFVGPEKIPGYELITCLGLDKEGNISLGYAHLVSHREKCFKSMPDEVRRGIEEAAVNLKRGNSCLENEGRGQLLRCFRSTSATLT